VSRERSVRRLPRFAMGEVEVRERYGCHRHLRHARWVLLSTITQVARLLHGDSLDRVAASLGPLGTIRHARAFPDLGAADRPAPGITSLTCRNVWSGVLGVKGSQVQILSSRRPDRAVPFDGGAARSAFYQRERGPDLVSAAVEQTSS
jgi:hypothetical protein